MAQNHALKKAARALQEQAPGMPYTVALREAKKQHTQQQTIELDPLNDSLADKLNEHGVPFAPLDLAEPTKPYVPMSQARLARSILSASIPSERTLFIYVKDQAERLREDGLEELFEDELDETFTINDNIYENIFQTCDLIGEPLEALSIYTYTEAEGASSLTEQPLTEFCWEVGRIAELTQHYFDAPVTDGHHIGNPEAHHHVWDAQEQEAMVQVILDVLVKETGTEYARVLETFVGGQNIFQLEFLALLARPFIGHSPQWTQEAYDKAASLWNSLSEIPLHPDDKRDNALSTSKQQE